MDLDYIITIIIFFIILFFISRTSFFKPQGGRLKTILVFFIISGFGGAYICFFGCQYVFYYLMYLNPGNDDGFTMALISHVSIAYLFGSLFYNMVIIKEQRKTINAIWIIALALLSIFITGYGMMII